MQPIPARSVCFGTRLRRRPGSNSVARYRLDLDLDRFRDVDLGRELPVTTVSWPNTCGRRRASVTASVRALGILVAISLSGLTSSAAHFPASGFTVTST
jgi:hypothetical protein